MWADDNDPVKRMIGTLVVGGEKSIPKPIRALVNEDDFSAAQKLANKWYADNRTSPDAVITYGAFLLARGLNDELRNIVARTDATPSVTLLSVELALAEERFEEAFKAIDDLFAYTDHGSHVWGYLGEVFEDTGQIEKAAICFEKALENRGRASDARRLASICLNRNNVPDAAYWLDQAVKRDPTDIDTVYFAGSCAFEAGEYDIAIRHLKRTIKNDPNHLNAEEKLLAAYEITGNYERVGVIAKRLLERDPFNIDLLNALAEAYFADNRADKAESILTRSAKTNPSVDAYIGLARCKELVGDFQGMVLHANDGLAHFEDPALYLNRGIAELKMGQKSDAQKSFAAALALDPNSDDLRAYGIVAGFTDIDAAAIAFSALALDDIEAALTFADKIVRQRDLTGFEKWLGYTDVAHPAWPAVQTLYACLAENEGFAAPFVKELEASLEASAAGLPLDWDFEVVHDWLDQNPGFEKARRVLQVIEGLE